MEPSHIVDDVKAQVIALDKRVAILNVHLDGLQKDVARNHDTTTRGLREIVERLDEKINGKLDAHASMLTSQARDLIQLASEMKHHISQRLQNHPMNRVDDKLDAVTITIPKNFFKTLLILFATVVAMVIAAMMGIPFKGLS